MLPTTTTTTTTAEHEPALEAHSITPNNNNNNNIAISPGVVGARFVSISATEREVILLSHLTHQKLAMLTALRKWKHRTIMRKHCDRHFAAMQNNVNNSINTSTTSNSTNANTSISRNSSNAIGTRGGSSRLVVRALGKGVLVRSYFQEWRDLLLFRQHKKQYVMQRVWSLAWRKLDRAMRNMCLQHRLLVAVARYHNTRSMRSAVKTWWRWSKGKMRARNCQSSMHETSVSASVGSLSGRASDSNPLFKAWLMKGKHCHSNRFHRFWILSRAYRRLRSLTVSCAQTADITGNHNENTIT